MKKIIGLLLVSLTVFFNIDRVRAEENNEWTAGRIFNAVTSAGVSELIPALIDEASKFEWSSLGWKKVEARYNGTCTLVDSRNMEDGSSSCKYTCGNFYGDELNSNDKLSFNYYIFYDKTNGIVHVIDPDSVVANGQFNSFENTEDQMLEKINKVLLGPLATLGYTKYIFANNISTVIKPNSLIDAGNNTQNVPNDTYFIKKNELMCRAVVPTVEVTYSSNLGLAFNFITIDRDPYAYDPKLDDPNYNSGDSVCGMLGGEDSEVIKLIKKIYGYIKIIIPILIIVLSIVDFIKVVISGKDDDMKKALSTFTKRIIIGVVFVLVPLIISLLINISGLATEYEGLGDGVKAIFCILG